MKVLIAYSSKTGNTEKIAESIKSECIESEILNIKDKDLVEKINFEDYDLLFLGGWIDRGTFNREALEFVEKIENQKVAFFFTLGAYPSSSHAYECVTNIKNVIEKNDNKVLGHFHCQGAVNPNTIEFMRKITEERGLAVDIHRERRWNNAAKHPNKEDFDAAVSFVDITIKNYISMMEA